MTIKAKKVTEDEVKVNDDPFTVLVEGSGIFNLKSNCDQLVIHKDSIEYEEGYIEIGNCYLNKPLTITTPKHLNTVTSSQSQISKISARQINEEIVEYLFEIVIKGGKDLYIPVEVSFYNFDIFTKFKVE